MKIRLCEITFREVGEGTNESIDLDKFDQYTTIYSFGMKMKKIAGAYRMGLGSEIYPNMASKDFTSTNFSI
jgi:N-acyl-L-homoserine lactone synthetase